MTLFASLKLRLTRLALLFEGPRRVWLFVAGVAVASAGIWVYVGRSISTVHVGGISLTWWELAAAFYLAEVFPVHLQFRKQAHTLSLTEIGLVLGLFFASPLNLLFAQIVGASAALAVNRRQRPMKLAFNVAELAFCTAVAVLIFRSLGNLDSTSVRTWGAVLLAAAAAHTTGLLFVSGVIGIANRSLRAASELVRTLGVSVLGTSATACLGLAAVELFEARRIGVLLLAVPLAACVLAFRGYMAQREQREHVEFLYESMRATQGAPEFGLAVGQLLVAARRLLRAEYAEILLISPNGDPPLKSASGPDGEVLMHHDAELDPIDADALEQVSAAERATLLPRRREPHVLDEFAARCNVGDAIFGALRGEKGPMGLLMVGERSGEVSTFGSQDIDLFETFAGHASMLLQNGRLEHSLAEVTDLKERLAHQAYHDSLTGLANRVHFVESITQTLTERPGTPSVAVLYLDLDRFKAVNDSWGHPAGDELLVNVAKRITDTVRPSDVPARLGGDEFAVLLRNTNAAGAKLVAERLTKALEEHFTLARGTTTVRASIGIATSGPEALTAEKLIMHADIAMYIAKSDGQRSYAVYEPRLHNRMRSEHRLALDLELAVERNEIVVHYQPVVSLADGRIHAVEALARWMHPTRGLVLPGEFLQKAEDTGLIISIGQSVIEQALATARTLLAPRGIGLWANLAPAQLTHERLIEDLAVSLTRAGVDAEVLAVEITESSLFGDEDRAVRAMTRLRDLGVHLSIDDFGTGYSSLSRLAAFPIEMVKIPMAFVQRLTADEPDETFVAAILGLAESLGLTTIAEGIEEPAQAARLSELGCELGQGFLFSKPLAVEDLTEVLEQAASDQRLPSSVHVVGSDSLKTVQKRRRSAAA